VWTFDHPYTVADTDVSDQLVVLEAAVAELREDLRIMVSRDVPLLKGTARAIVDARSSRPKSSPTPGTRSGRM